jgi:3-oxosteroid 1-dehydrogenase
VTTGYEDWDIEADALVVGSGAAALSAALTAAARGCRVVVLEKEDRIGGTTAKAGATFWVPNNRLMREAGLADPRDDALRYMARLSYPQLYDPSDETLGLRQAHYDLIAAFYDHGAVMFDHHCRIGALDVELDLETPDYHADLEEDKAPYGRHLRPRGIAEAGGATGGELLVRRMDEVAKGLGVRVLTGHRAAEILRSDAGEVIGLEVRVGRRTVLARSQRAVIFGSGGFVHNPDLRLAYLRGPIFGGCAAHSSTGDFVRMGLNAGAALGNMSNAWWSQVPLEVVLRTGPTIKDVWMPFGDSMIQVNRFGRRVVNEKMVYNERGQVHHYWDPSKREYPNLLLFMIYDDAVANHPGPFTSMRQPVPLAGEKAGYVVSGQTWSELVANLDQRLASLVDHTGGVRLDVGFEAELARTIERFNSFAWTGRDLDFGRGDTPIQLAWNGPPRHPNSPNPTMHPFATVGPYHAIILAGGALDTKGGPVINARAQVLDREGEPIAGLYGAGNCIAAPVGQAYWPAGATIGPALTFGYIAGMEVASERVKSL